MIHIPPKYILIFSSGVAIILFIYHLIVDGLESKYNNYGYYLSESALFSIIWLLIIPGVYMMYKYGWYDLSLKRIISFILLVSSGHILIYSLLIWSVSMVFFEHTYHIWGNLQYGFLKYLVVLIILYTLVTVLLKYFFGRINVSDHIIKSGVTKHILVSDQNKKHLIKTNEILFIRANTPYIEIHTSDKKYLEQNSLKEIIQLLDKDVFIRVHKSTILNVTCVKNFTSRMNGDYDVSLFNGEAIRVSRNYAASFKTKLNPPTQVGL
jgi:hypothetical protein